MPGGLHHVTYNVQQLGSQEQWEGMKELCDRQKGAELAPNRGGSGGGGGGQQVRPIRGQAGE